MPRNVYEIEINNETPQADLEECTLAAEHTSDSNVRKAAAKARAELSRREREMWADRFNAESRERVKGQQFQEAQITRQIESQDELTLMQISAQKKLAVMQVKPKRNLRRSKPKLRRIRQRPLGSHRMLRDQPLKRLSPLRS